MTNTNSATPLMEQYLAIKARYADAVLFFRMGDFYEMFFDDAKTASEVLGIALTSRSHGKAASVPLAGFPHHALDTYLTKMIKAGYRVAICEQIEDPKLAKTIVKRDVLEVVSPGTALADELLESKRNNFLVSVTVLNDWCGFAIADISTGEFLTSEMKIEKLREQMHAFQPAEILVAEEQLAGLFQKLPELNAITITRRDGWIFAYDYAYETLTSHFNTLSLKGFGCEDLHTGVSAAGALIHYLKEIKKSELKHISRLARYDDREFLVIDETTRRNLELIQPLMANGQRRATLLSVLDQTKTAMGARLFLNWLLRPLMRFDRIQTRLDAVTELVTQPTTRTTTRELLGEVSDLERLLSKVSTGRANARDLINLKNTLQLIPEFKQNLAALKSELLAAIQGQLVEQNEIVAKINQAIVDDPPLALTEGGLIRTGYHVELDELRNIAGSGKDWIARLQASEREKTGIPSLKVNYNKVFGYYIEVTNPHLSKIPPNYLRKQTLVNAERFITPELKEYEERVLGAEEKMIALEYTLFDEIRQFVAQHVVGIQENARRLAELDCLANLAEIAWLNNYVRPQIDDGEEISIQAGRHPVIEKLLPHGEAFVPNDLKIDNTRQQILIITGPNMAGKSTYLRQIGLIVLMAQMGSFIPVKSARIGLVDKIFTRVGASDNLAAGESTFLTEMNETANILNNATPKSLILLDEIGRGTSTFDGLSIAWAVAEYLHNHEKLAAKTLFATHYHELTELARILPRVKNYNVAVKEWGDHVVFLRKIVEGGCDNSYGIYVAQLAGLPIKVIQRAKEILKNLEANELTPNAVPKLALGHVITSPSKESVQLDLFEVQEKKLREELLKIDPDTLTPRQALDKLFELRELTGQNPPEK
ncbi:DNA mismatch repair protein MutS [candidate division KSB1 bacterium]|nr:DNA mismatch repair protein MutS [candidate division KSB1 bacterium]